MDKTDSYNILIKDIQKSLRNKIGYPSSLMSMLRGYYHEEGLFISHDPKYQKLVDNEIIGIKNDGFGEIFTNNVGDPWQESGSVSSHELKTIEVEVIKILGKYFGLKEEESRGYVTSGGTEGNMAGIWWAKLRLSGNSNRNLIVIATKDRLHYSINKICNIMNINLCLIDPEPSGGMDIIKLKAFLESKVKNSDIENIIVVATIGSTIIGSNDEVPSINEALSKFKKSYNKLNYIIHIDGALCGIIMPIVKPFGQISNYFDELNVSSISISGHKFLGTNVCGIAVTKKTFIDQAFSSLKAIEYCGDIHDTTVSGSRSGLNCILLHNTLSSLELRNNSIKLERIVNNNLRNAGYFYNKLVSILDVTKVTWLPNQFNVIFPRPSDRIMRKYQLMPTSNNMCVACILLNVTQNLIDEFMIEYSKDLNDNHFLQ